DAGIALLILSRTLDGDDAIEVIARFDPSLVIPPTIVLGGQATITADFIHVIPDPIDTQAIYRIASEALAYHVVHQEIAVPSDEVASDEDLTQMSVERPARDTQQPVTKPNIAPMSPVSLQEAINTDEELSFTEVTGLDQIADQLDLLESADAMLNDA